MDNRIADFEEAIENASKFIKRAEIAVLVMRKREMSNDRMYHSQEIAAAKRTSMDLTRSLAKVRNHSNRTDYT